MTIEMIDKWVTSLRFNEIKMKMIFIFLFFIDFILCRLAETDVSGSPSVVTFSEVTSVWGVSAVALNVYACGRQKALTMPAYCIAANCNNSQATQSISMHEFPRNRPAVRRQIRTIQKVTLRLRLSHAHWSCVASTSLSAIS